MRRRWTPKAGLLPALLLTVWFRPAVGLSKEPAATGPAREKVLNAQAERLAGKWTGRLGDGYITHIDRKRHLVYVSAVDKKALAHVVRLLGAYHDAQRKTLFPEPLRWNVAVIMPTLKDYRTLVPNAKAHGIYSSMNRTLISISYSSVLIHEFTHALHHNDQALANQRHPIWIVEGLATLFQSSRFKDGRLEVLNDTGLIALQKALKKNKAYPLAELFSMPHKVFMQNAAACYPQARYVMLYLHRLGKLEQFYKAYKAGYASDRSGVKALEETLGESLARIEAGWKKWALAQKPPWRPARKGRAHLGVRMKQTAEGVKIIGFVRHSAAQRARLLKTGDIVISVAGRPIRAPNALTAAVQSCRPGHIVEIEVIRNGRTTVVKQLLGVMPK